MSGTKVSFLHRHTIKLYQIIKNKNQKELLRNMSFIFNKIYMKKLFLFIIFIFSSSPIFAEGFQGLPWGSKPSQILKKYPNAHEVIKSDEPLMTCLKSDGHSYNCSVSKFLCLDKGIACHPNIKLDTYIVGNIAFDIEFYFSKKKQLNGVNISHKKSLVGEEINKAKSIYDDILYNLQRKYGNPFRQNAYQEAVGEQCVINGMCLAHGFSEWRKENTIIFLKINGIFDPNSHKFVEIGGEPEIKISYSPIINDINSKL